jgi:GTP-binding protein
MIIKTAEFVKSAVKPVDYPAGGLPEVALAGRSNVGKSSLLNRLLNRKGLARTSKTPGRTQLLNFFLVNDGFFLVDLPGYGYARAPESERKRWGLMIEAYLGGSDNLRGLLLLVDSRHPPSELDKQMYGWLVAHGLTAAVVATKDDKLSRSQLARSLATIRKDLSLPKEISLIPFSSETGQGREELLDLIEGWVVRTEEN